MSSDLFFEPMRSVQVAYKNNENEASENFIVVSPSNPEVTVTILQGIDHNSDLFRPIQTDTSSFNLIHSPEFTDTTLQTITDRSESLLPIQNDISYLNLIFYCLKVCCSSILSICILSCFAAVCYFMSTIFTSLNTQVAKTWDEKE